MIFLFIRIGMESNRSTGGHLLYGTSGLAAGPNHQCETNQDTLNQTKTLSIAREKLPYIY